MDWKDLGVSVAMRIASACVCCFYRGEHWYPYKVGDGVLNCPNPLKESELLRWQ